MMLFSASLLSSLLFSKHTVLVTSIQLAEYLSHGGRRLDFLPKSSEVVDHLLYHSLVDYLLI
jgi:hypothetical protein